MNAGEKFHFRFGFALGFSLSGSSAALLMGLLEWMT